MQHDGTIVPDSEYGGWLALLPAFARPYALLARFDDTCLATDENWF